MSKDREEIKTTTPKNVEVENRRDGYFKDMNKELNEKIDEIRKKYEKERQKLYQKYQVSS